MQRIIFDTAAFLAGLENYFDKVYTTNYVLEEIKDKHSKELLYLSISAGKVIIMEPSNGSKKYVMKVLEEVGEYTLSKTDISIIALAIDLRPCIVVTDDVSIINVLTYLKINYQTIKLRKVPIKQKRFIYVCYSCKKRFSKLYDACPLCGGKLMKENS